MFQTFFGTALQLSASPMPSAYLDLEPVSITHVNRNIHMLSAPGIDSLFADFDQLTFSDCTTAGSENLDATCNTGTLLTPIVVQDGVV